MVSIFKSNSISPWVVVDPETWEILKFLEENNERWIQRPWSFTPPIYTQDSIDCARSVTSNLCEKVIARVSSWSRVKKWNNRWHDIVTRKWVKIEAKVWRIWNSAVIKENQLFKFDASFWWFLFYRTLKNLPPSYYTSLKRNISPVAMLKRSITLEVAYILPTEVMRYYWNTAWVKKWVISTTWIAHRPFACSRAEWLINNAEIPWIRREKKLNTEDMNFL